MQLYLNHKYFSEVAQNFFVRDYKILYILFQDTPEEKIHLRDTSTNKTLPHKIDEVSKDKTLPRDTPTHKIHPQKSNEKIEVYNAYGVAQGASLQSLFYVYLFQNYYYFQDISPTKPKVRNVDSKKHDKVREYIY